MVGDIEYGRQAFERRAWREAYEALSAAERLNSVDLERLAVAAHPSRRLRGRNVPAN